MYYYILHQIIIMEEQINTNVSIDLNFNLDKCETGDVVLFEGDYYVSKIIEYATHSKWSHVGIVVKDPKFLFNKESIKGTFLYESDGIELDDIDTGGKMCGVQIVDLQKKINNYKGTVGIRKLHWNKSSKDVDDILQVVYNTTYHKSYDWNIIDLLDPLIYSKHWILDKLLRIDHRRTSAFFCSAFAAYVYTQLGLFKKTTEWSLILPKYFADVVNLENGYKLGELTIIKNK